jgi:hypothetical protein
MQKISLGQVKRESWFRGNLRYLTRPGPQREIYDFIKARDKSFSEFSPYVLNLHRRLGKTFLGVLFGIEACLKAPRKFIKFAAPSLTMASDILEEHWGIIMSDCPSELEPKGYRGEKFTFRNPRWAKTGPHEKSILRLYGVQNDRGNKMRGGSTDVCILDECREMDDLEYTWGSVLLPTFKDRKAPLAIMLSTAPDSMDHPFASRYIPEAKERDKYFVCPGSQDPNWTQEEDDLFAREMGGRETPDYLREIECKLVSDTSKLIIPEFVGGEREGEENIYVHEEDWDRPDLYVAYVFSDMGGAGKRVDNCGILFGFMDFHNSVLVIEDELLLRDEDTKTIAEKWMGKVKERFGSKGVVRAENWVDTNPQQLLDLYRLYNIEAKQYPKSDKETSRKLLRTAFNLGKVSIHKRCKETIYQLTNGNKTKTGDFQRSKRLGHCDLVSALIGINRMADFEENPFPAKSYSREDYFVPPSGPKKVGWDRYFKKAR